MRPFGGKGHCTTGLLSHTTEDDLKSCMEKCSKDAQCRYASHRESAQLNCALYNANTCVLKGSQEYTTFIKIGVYSGMFIYIIENDFFSTGEDSNCY